MYRSNHLTGSVFDQGLLNLNQDLYVLLTFRIFPVFQGTRFVPTLVKCNSTTYNTWVKAITRNVYRCTLITATALFLSSCSVFTKSSGLSANECQLLLEFGNQNRITENAFPWLLEDFAVSNMKYIDEHQDDKAPGQVEAWRQSVNDALERERKKVAAGAGEYLVGLNEGSLKEILLQIAKDPSAGNIGILNGYAEACDLGS